MSIFSKFILTNAGSSFTPIDIPSLFAWYDVTDSEAIVHDGAKVSQLIDKSGNSRTLVQNNNSLRPNYHQNGGSNNLPYIRLSDSHNIGIGGLNLPQPYSIYIVYKMNSFLQFGTLYQLGDNFTSGFANFFFDSQRQSMTMVSNVAWRPVSNNYYKQDQFFASGQKFTNKIVPYKQGETSFMSFNDSRFRWFESPGNATLDRIFLGGLQYTARCDIQEMFVFSEEISLENEILINKYLKKKYNLSYQQQGFFLGDSITAGANASDIYHTYVDLVGQSTGMFVHNSGLSGTTVVSTGSGNSLQETYNLYTGGNAEDYIFLMYGTNDTYSLFWKNTYKSIIQSIIDDGKNPAKIVLMTPPYQPANVAKYAEMIPAMIEISTDLGLTFINIYESTLANGGASLLSDGIHPNDAGMQVIANTIVASL